MIKVTTVSLQNDIGECRTFLFRKMIVFSKIWKNSTYLKYVSD